MRISSLTPQIPTGRAVRVAGVQLLGKLQGDRRAISGVPREECVYVVARFRLFALFFIILFLNSYFPRMWRGPFIKFRFFSGLGELLSPLPVFPHSWRGRGSALRQAGWGGHEEPAPPAPLEQVQQVDASEPS